MFAAINKGKCCRFQRSSNGNGTTTTMAKQYNKLYIGHITENFSNLFSCKLQGASTLIQKFELIPSKESKTFAMPAMHRK